MNKKLLSVLVCLAMLISSLSMLSYAADIIIDLGPLFEEDTPTPDDNKDEENKDDNRPGNNGNTGDTEKDDDTTTPTPDDNKDDEQPADPSWDNPFTDVKTSDWYYDSVKYAVQKKLFNGVSETAFAPNAALTRGMLVTILYRAEGSPEATGSEFSDVASDDWFYNAVAWAAKNNIVMGYEDGTFKPNANITREQIATIIYRYASFKGRDVSKGDTTNIVSFYSDSMSVSSYAKTALQYTVGEGIMMGKTEKTLNPQDNATRAEAATVLRRFLGE